MRSIVGRHREIEILNKYYSSSNSEFVAVYGRRRVGKTFLIRTVFDQKFTFQLTGIGNATLKQQLTNFHLSIQKQNPTTTFLPATSWIDAFQQLISCLEKSSCNKKVVFFDELPWFDTAGSGFIQALEHFWNSWASARTDILLITCGSAASWMINKLINNKGGLHNRVTGRMKLLPFSLGECEEFLNSKKTVLDRYQLVQLYMVLGGIPFYWDEVQPGLSAAQNIENICFAENGLLRNEFNNLYSSLFSKSERHVAIVKTMAQKSTGLTREEIIAGSGLANAGSATRLLEELETSGFIRKYVPFGKKMRNSLYQLTDFYSLFYLKFIENARLMEQNNWLSMIDSPKWRAWSGYAFEQVCMYHVQQLKMALGISGVQTEVSSWRSSTSAKGTQIDLVIDRRDQVINLCEMKFSINPFIIDKSYATDLQNKIGTFRSETGTRKSVFLTLVTTFGLQQNSYSASLIQNDLRMDILFRNLR
jgi:uncharacterized protein